MWLFEFTQNRQFQFLTYYRIKEPLAPSCLKKIESKIHQFCLFQKPRRTSSFHETPSSRTNCSKHNYLIFSKKIGEQWLWTLRALNIRTQSCDYLRTMLMNLKAWSPWQPLGVCSYFWYTLSPKPPNIGIYAPYSWGALNNMDNSFENTRVLGLRVGAHWKLNRRQQLCMSTVANCLWRVVHLWSLDVQSFNYFIEQSSETQMPCMGCCQALSGYVSLPLPT